MVWAPGKDAYWMSTEGGVLGMSIQEETPGWRHWRGYISRLVWVRLSEELVDLARGEERYLLGLLLW